MNAQTQVCYDDRHCQPEKNLICIRGLVDLSTSLICSAVQAQEPSLLTHGMFQPGSQLLASFGAPFPLPEFCKPPSCLWPISVFVSGIRLALSMHDNATLELPTEDRSNTASADPNGVPTSGHRHVTLAIADLKFQWRPALYSSHTNQSTILAEA